MVTDCGQNVGAAFDNKYDWMRCACHLIHNCVKAGLTKVTNEGKGNAGGVRRHMLFHALNR